MLVIFQVFAVIFFKGLSVSSALAAFLLLAYFVNPDPDMDEYYKAIGISLGLIIVAYVYPSFTKMGDTRGLYVAVFIVATLSYLPASAVIFKYVQEKSATTVTVLKPNIEAFNRAAEERNRLEEERSEYINKPMFEQQDFEEKKTGFIKKRVEELRAWHKYQSGKHKGKIKWATKDYEKYKKAMKGFNSKEDSATSLYEKKFLAFEEEYKKRLASNFLKDGINRQEAIIQKNDPTEYNLAVQKAKESIPFWLVALLVFVIGVSIDLLGELPYFLGLRKKSLGKGSNEKEEIQTSSIPLLSAPKKTADKNGDKLLFFRVLEERYRGVVVGEEGKDWLVPKSKLPFAPAQRDKMVSKLNKALLDAGYIEGTTKHRALKPYDEALKYIEGLEDVT